MVEKKEFTEPCLEGVIEIREKIPDAEPDAAEAAALETYRKEQSELEAGGSAEEVTALYNTLTINDDVADDAEKQEEETKDTKVEAKDLPAQKKSGIDYCQINVRLKPLGAGMSDRIAEVAKPTGKRLKGYKDDNLIITDLHSKADVVYDFPTNVIKPDQDQESTYNTIMPGHIDKFFQGYNITILAYGQTGSGKTYTMIAPVGTFNKKGGTDDSGAILPHYGIFPRAALEIWQKFNEQGCDKDSVLTVNLTEDKWFRPNCMMTKTVVNFDIETNNYVGQSEIVVKSAADLTKAFKVVEKERNILAHAMNSTSSRSNAVMELKKYTVKGDALHLTTMKILDLAGSERQEKAKADTGGGILNVDGVLNNVQLLTFAKCIENMGQLKKVVKGGDKIPTSIPWKEVGLTKLLKSIFDGTSYVGFVFALSQHPENGGETWCTLLFAKKCSVLKTKVTKPKALNLPKLLAKYKEALPKTKRENYKVYYKSQISILEDLESKK